MENAPSPPPTTPLVPPLPRPENPAASAEPKSWSLEWVIAKKNQAFLDYQEAEQSEEVKYYYKLESEQRFNKKRRRRDDLRRRVAAAPENEDERRRRDEEAKIIEDEYEAAKKERQLKTDQARTAREELIVKRAIYH
jgi:hypothetical protein